MLEKAVKESARPSRRGSRAMKNAHFESDLSDAQWDIIRAHLPTSKGRVRPRTPLCGVVEAAILYITNAVMLFRQALSSQELFGLRLFVRNKADFDPFIQG